MVKTPDKNLFPSISQRRRLLPLFLQLRWMNRRQSLWLSDTEIWAVTLAISQQKVDRSTKE